MAKPVPMTVPMTHLVSLLMQAAWREPAAGDTTASAGKARRARFAVQSVTAG